LPPFYAAPAPVPATVPQPDGTDVMVPLTLAIGNNVPNTYMGFGDSITAGEGSSDDAGYRDRLAAKLGQHFGRATVINQGIAGTRSNFGAGRIDGSLIDQRPAYTLILYGTNDWNQNECKTAFPCFTLASLRQMVLAARYFDSLPVLATIPPCNVGFDERATPERNEFYFKMNELIRPMAREEGAVLVDLEAAFLREPDLASLFVDHIHPSDAGYEIIASEFFAAISGPATTAVAAPDSPLAFGFVGPPRVLRVPASRGVLPGPRRGRAADE
jgi:lysophospholipase L1-like esterase